jgi:hypothetical protein
MNTRHIFSVIFILGCLLAVSCKEDLQNDHLDSNAPAPASINRNDITHKNLAGGAVIRYKLPKDENLLYVQAEYETAPGIVREVKASRYADSLMVEGFGSAGTYNVNLYTVGKNEKKSEPVVYQISPEPAPVEAAFETLTLVTTFGGVRGNFQNDAGTPLTVVLSADTTGTGIFTQLRAYTLSDQKASFVYLDMDSIITTFRVYLKDRWGNRTEYREFVIQPMFEELVPKNTWEKWTMPSDFDTPAESETTYGAANLWDGISNLPNSNILATSNAGPSFPYTITIRLGTTVMISRIQMHHRMNYEFTGKTPRKIEFWGSDSDSPGDDLLLSGDWFCLGRFESKIPSSSASPNAEDKTYANGEGERFLLEPTDDTPDAYRSVKYIRLRPLEVWDGSLAGQIIIAEIDLYGQLTN